MRALPLLILLAAAAPAPDPLAAVYGNTVLCLDANGQDFCHLWLAADGSFVLFGPAALGQAGLISTTSPGSICLHIATKGPIAPAGWSVAAPAPLPDGACLDLGNHDIGDRWKFADGTRLMLIAGHR